VTFVEPAYRWVPPSAAPDSADRAGRDAAELAAGMGLILDAEQVLALGVMLAERPNGQWAAHEAVLICARQNMKTLVLIVSALYDAFVREVPLITWTAHRFRTGAEAFRDMRTFIESSPDLDRRVQTVRTAMGEEGIHLKNGSRINFLARTTSSGRGLSADTVILDEGLYLTPSQMGSLLPTLSARPNPQVRVGSSAGVTDSDVLRSYRDRGRAGSDPSLVYLEWSAEEGCAEPDCGHTVGTAGCALDDEARWRQANPAIGRRIDLDFVRAERRSLDPAEFARERLSWWDDPAMLDAVIPLSAWLQHLTKDPQPVGLPAFALDLAPDRGTASVAVASRSRTGPPLVDLTAADVNGTQLVDARSGTDWVVPRLRELADRHSTRRVVVSGRAAQALGPAMTAAGLDVQPMTASDLLLACGAFYDAAVAPAGHGLVHVGRPQLENSLSLARRVEVDDGWRWGRRKSAGDITPLVAMTCAFWALSPQPARQTFVAFR
jgi:hypothetical protein